MNAAVRCMAKELAPSGGRANTISPALTDTVIYEQSKNAGGDSDGFSMRLYRQYLGVAKPLDIANLIVFLLSDASRMITGTNICIDGGLLSN